MKNDVFCLYINDKISTSAIREIRKTEIEISNDPSTTKLNVYHDCAGGSVDAAFTIIDILKEIESLGVKITHYIEHDSSSCAAIIALSVGKIVFRKGSILMVHSCRLNAHLVTSQVLTREIEEMHLINKKFENIIFNHKLFKGKKKLKKAFRDGKDILLKKTYDNKMKTIVQDNGG